MGWEPRETIWPGVAVMRWLLLAVVLAGLFGMHVLTPDDGAAGHGTVPMATMVAPHHGASPPGGAAVPMTDAAAKPVAVTPASRMSSVPAPLTAAPAPPGTDHSAMATCILFLIVGTTLLVLTLLRRRVAQPPSSPGRVRANLRDYRRHAPPGRVPRLALCVIRI